MAHSTTLMGSFAPDVAARLEGALARPDAIWATDADGTLWRDDIGEAFLQQLIADRALVSPEARIDVWRSYEERVARDRATGYAWAVQVMAGMSEAEVIERADAFARQFVPSHLIPEMAQLLAFAGEHPIWIVSASSRWIVAAAARVLGLRDDRIIGMDVAVRDGRLTSEIVPPIIYGAGKVQAFRQRVGRAPALATGDSANDVELLRFAGAGLLVVHPGKTDDALLVLAREQDWMTHAAGLERSERIADVHPSGGHPRLRALEV